MKIGTVESIELNKKSLKEAIPANGLYYFL